MGNVSMHKKRRLIGHSGGMIWYVLYTVSLIICEN